MMSLTLTFVSHQSHASAAPLVVTLTVWAPHVDVSRSSVVGYKMNVSLVSKERFQQHRYCL